MIKKTTKTTSVAQILAVDLVDGALHLVGSVARPAGDHRQETQECETHPRRFAVPTGVNGDIIT